MVIQYPYLPEGREIKYVDFDNKYMREAFLVSYNNSGDRQMPTGAVIVKNDEIVAKGANQVALKNTKLKQIHSDKGLCMRKILKIKSGEKYWLCPGCASPAKHAEQEAVRNARNNNVKTDHSDLYLWGHWWCCQSCWDKMIESGINNVFLVRDSEVLFNKENKNNIIGKQFEYFKSKYGLN